VKTKKPIEVIEEETEKFKKKLEEALEEFHKITGLYVLSIGFMSHRRQADGYSIFDAKEWKTDKIVISKIEVGD
jgi:hypothetical protein